jgi:hypothetical protein
MLFMAAGERARKGGPFGWHWLLRGIQDSALTFTGQRCMGNVHGKFVRIGTLPKGFMPNPVCDSRQLMRTPLLTTACRKNGSSSETKGRFRKSS